MRKANYDDIHLEEQMSTSFVLHSFGIRIREISNETIVEPSSYDKDNTRLGIGKWNSGVFQSS
ncbi:hypothetical protein ACTXT7_005288 [Hymenolepis weldensis]